MQTGCDQLHIPVNSFASHIAETILKTNYKIWIWKLCHQLKLWILTTITRKHTKLYTNRPTSSNTTIKILYAIWPEWFGETCKTSFFLCTLLPIVLHNHYYKSGINTADVIHKNSHLTSCEPHDLPLVQSIATSLHVSSISSVVL